MKYIDVIKKYFTLLFTITGFLLTLASCNKYLDAKSDKQLTTPGTLQDLQGIIDNDGLMNQGYPGDGDIASDFYYVSDADYNALATNNQSRSEYIWADAIDYTTSWQQTYQKIFQLNVVLDNIDNINLSGATETDRNTVKGAALFLRAYALLKATQIFTMPYNAATVSSSAGMPLKLSSDINEPVFRSTLQQTYDRMVKDFTNAASLLPPNSSPVTRPNKTAAFAALAYTYLIMQQFDKAGNYADSCLQLYNTLMDYNTLSASSASPIPLFNSEVFFQARSSGGTTLAPARCKADSLLYKSYISNDLRKTIFYKSNGDGSYGFKGYYDGNTSSSAFFCGLATDEMYLIKAECLARAGNTNIAMNTLNSLLQKRFKTGTFIPFTAVNADDALNQILAERKKELCFRSGLRWADLRRLNQETRFAVTLKRIVNGQVYQLKPDDLHYAFLIPQAVINSNGIEQNKR